MALAYAAPEVVRMGDGWRNFDTVAERADLRITNRVCRVPMDGYTVDVYHGTSGDTWYGLLYSPAGLFIGWEMLGWRAGRCMVMCSFQWFKDKAEKHRTGKL